MRHSHLPIPPVVALVFAAFLTVALASCNASPTPTAAPPARSTSIDAVTPAETADPGILAPRTTPAAGATVDPLLAQRLEAQSAALARPLPILLLDAGLDENQGLAQDLAVADPRVQEYIRDPGTGAPLRSEVFGVYPLRDSDLTEATAGCRGRTCYRAELYNFAGNLTTTAVVDTEARQVLAVNHVPDTQPDIPEHLTELATRIAIDSPEVAEALGRAPGAADAMMANTKTALNRSRCERSHHLCVAPTFHVGERVLWAIVDLTDLRLVGLRWTDVGQSEARPVTEQRLQNAVITERFCERETALAQAGWELDYMLTSSDGLRVSDVRFGGRPILISAKLVDWHVSYSKSEGFGYSDAVGCPFFSQAAVVAVEGPAIVDIVRDGEVVGFSLAQDFWSEGWPAPCNYKYRQRYDFYADGRFRVVVGSIGRGCGNDGMYRPVIRIAFAGDDNSFAEWDGSGWSDWPEEQWRLQAPDTAYSPEGYQYRMINPEGQGFYVEPGRGQFGDGGRGDDAYLFATGSQSGADEGESDLVTIGPCCNDDYQQGPEKFIEPNPDALAGKPLVLWYVAQLKNDDTPGSEYCWAQSVVENGVYQVREYPCYAGPLFVPIPEP